MHVKKYQVNPYKEEIRYMTLKLLRKKQREQKKSNLDKHKRIIMNSSTSNIPIKRS